MSFSRLTIQSLQAAQNRAPYTAFAGLGAADNRPSVDYVRAGDVIRVNLAWDRPVRIFELDQAGLYTRFKAALQGKFNVLAMSPQTYWISAGGDITIDLQPRGDFARLADVVSIVAHDAQNAGMQVNVAATRAEFISKVEATGGTTPTTLPDPRTGPQIGSESGSFLNNLAQSPTTLALILGAAVALIVAVKR